MGCSSQFQTTFYSGFNLNQDKATKPQTVQIVRQGEATPCWFKFNPLYHSRCQYHHKYQPDGNLHLTSGQYAPYFPPAAMPICAAQNGNALFAVAQEIPSSGKEFENASYKIQYHYLNSVKYTGVIVNPNKESLFRHVRAGGNPSPDLSGIFRGCRDFKLLDSRLRALLSGINPH